jgi:ribonuclease VapC
VIVDASAICSVMLEEPDLEIYLSALNEAQSCKMSVANWLEASIRIDHAGTRISSAAFDELIEKTPIDLIPVTPSQGVIARRAYQMYGKGTGLPAQLNFGDCFAYALAKETGEPLLFKGNDFRHTDIDAVL